MCTNVVFVLKSWKTSRDERSERTTAKLKCKIETFAYHPCGIIHSFILLPPLVPHQREGVMHWNNLRVAPCTVNPTSALNIKCYFMAESSECSRQGEARRGWRRCGSCCCFPWWRNFDGSTLTHPPPPLHLLYKCLNNSFSLFVWYVVACSVYIGMTFPPSPGSCLTRATCASSQLVNC